MSLKVGDKVKVVVCCGFPTCRLIGIVGVVEGTVGVYYCVKFPDVEPTYIFGDVELEKLQDSPKSYSLFR